MRAITTAFAVIALLALSPLPCRADAKQSELIPAGHWVYDAVRYLAVETGTTALSANAPASYAEIRSCFGDVPEARLSSDGRNLYARVARFLGESEPLWSAGAGAVDAAPALTVAACLPPDGDVGFSLDRVARFDGRPPLVSLPLTVGFTPRATAFLDLAFGTGFWAANGPNGATNVPLSADSFDANAPARAYVSVGNAFLTATVGRGALSVGKTLTGSMILSDSCDRLDYASLVLFSPRVRVSMTPIELAPDRFAYFHDLSFRPLSFLSVTLSEAATVHSALDPRYLNPATIFHNYAGWRDDYGQEDGVSPVGTQFGLSAEAVPVPGLRVYGQLALNQLQTSYELSKYGDSAEEIPNSVGGLAGIEFVRAVRDGYLVATAEGLRSNPWLYVLANPDIGFVWSRLELVAPDGRTTDPVAGWLGSPYGRDATVGVLKVLYDEPSVRSLSAEYRFERAPLRAAFSGESGGPYGTRHGIALSGKSLVGDCAAIECSVGYRFMRREGWAHAPEAAVSVEWKPR